MQVTIRSAPPSMTAPPADFSDLQPDQTGAHLKWYAKVEGYPADSMFALTERFDELLREDGRVPHTIRTELRGRLDELRTWRNALCHGAWFGFSGAGAGVPQLVVSARAPPHGRVVLSGTAPHSEPRVQPDPDLVLHRAGPGAAAVEGT